ncbi:hypothetical protein ABZX90_38400 [Streptomyces sp. NPDC002935]|uniref:hypothetical protein n=1 Tax=Streptomyces sp. NPDC002935 TaxID=3154545 RepID=UPI0033B52835
MPEPTRGPCGAACSAPSTRLSQVPHLAPQLGELVLLFGGEQVIALALSVFSRWVHEQFGTGPREWRKKRTEPGTPNGS